MATEGRCRIYATVPSGFEFCAKDECKEKFGEDVSEFHTERGALRFDIATDRVEELLKLRSVDHLFAVMLETTKEFSQDKEQAVQSTEELLTNDVQWKRGFQVWKTLTKIINEKKDYVDIPSNFVEGGEFVPSFRATCYRSGKHVFTSQEAMHSFGGYLNSKFKWKVDLKNYDVEVVLIIDDNRVSICLSLTDEALFRRNITHFGPTTMRATIAYNMVRLGNILPGDIVCDPMCGSGSIPIEAALGYPSSFVLCSDNYHLATPRTLNNILDLQKTGISLNNIDVLECDVIGYPLKPSSVDVWVTDFPFGKRHKCNRFDLYPKALAAMARASKPGVSRAVILTKDRQAMAASLRSSKYWYMKRQVNINIGGLSACVYCLLRTLVA